MYALIEITFFWCSGKTRELHDKGNRHKQAVKDYMDKVRKEKKEKEEEDKTLLHELKQIEKVCSKSPAAPFALIYNAPSESREKTLEREEREREREMYGLAKSITWQRERVEGERCV